MPRVIVLANRAPFSCEMTDDRRLTIRRSSGGLVTALEPLVESWSGTWVAQSTGSGDAIITDHRGGVSLPLRDPRYRVRYVWLSDAEQQGYYCGFANEGLWPLCHEVDVQPVFRASDFDSYRRANTRFAEAVVDEAHGHHPVVLVQDYHFALAPGILRRRLPLSTIVAFWHIPWPAPESIATCAWARALIEGLLGSDIVGFQTPGDCANFLASAARILGARIDRRNGQVLHRDRSTLIRAYPVGVDCTDRVVRDVPAPEVCRQQWCRRLGLSPDVQLIVGVDRLDYTKGIPHKLAAFERMLDAYPNLRGGCALVQVAEPSRSSLCAYQGERAQVVKAAARVNERFTERHRPVHVIESHHDAADVYRLYRAADVGYVGSLRDGMNLVAKEFVFARKDERGVLVLSRYAGAAQQLRDAVMIDPFAVNGSADALARALTMSSEEQRYRMRKLRANVAAFDGRWWMQQLMADAMSVHRRTTSEGNADAVERSLSA